MTRDGATHFISYHTAVHQDDDGKIAFVDYFLRDITEPKEAHQNVSAAGNRIQNSG